MGYSTLKAALDAVVRTNRNQQITGSNLNGVMTQILQGVDLLERANPADTTGMNKVVLDKSKTFAEQVTGTNTIYEIRDAFNLSNETINIPNGCVLKFNGGSISNGKIQGNIRIDAGLERCFTNVTFGGKLESPLLVEWFGAAGDGVTDDSAAFAAMFASYVNTQMQTSYTSDSALPVFLAKSPKGYLVSSGITISNLNCVFECTDLIYTGTGTAVSLLGLWSSNIKIHGVYHTGSSHWTNANLVGVLAQGIQRCNLSIDVIDHFRRGIVVSASAGEAVYSNMFHLNAFYYTLQCFVIKTAGSGWANHNYVYGGISDYFTGELESDTTPRFLFGIEGGGTYVINSWEFSDNGIEGGSTGHGTIPSYYLYVYAGAKFIESKFLNGRIEAINTDCSVLLNDASVRNINFDFFSNETPTIKNSVGGDPLYLVGGILFAPIQKGGDNVTDKIILDYEKDFMTYARGSRSTGVVPKSPYMGEVVKATPDIFTLVPGMFMAVYKVNGATDLIVNKTKIGRLGMILFKADGTGFSAPTEVTGFGFIAFSSIGAANPWYNQFVNNATRYYTLADTGDDRWSALVKFAADTNVAYVGFIVGAGVSAEIESIGETHSLIPYGDRDYISVTSAGVQNAHFYAIRDEKIYLKQQNVFLKVLQEGAVSSLVNYIRNISVTLTQGSNVMVCAANASYLWIGFIGYVDGQRFRVLSISGNDVTMDIVAKENFTGNITIDTGLVSYEFAVLTGDEIAALPVDTYYVKGGLVYNSTTGALMYLNGSTWKSLAGA